MENATKALLMAGGMALALIIVSMLVFGANKISSIGETRKTKEEARQLAEFNQGYESYSKQLMYGADVISVINKAEDNNIKYKDDPAYQITVTVIDKDGNSIVAVEGTDVNNTLLTDLKGYYDGDGNKVDGKKTNAYKCTSITYSDLTGRVNSMTFKWDTKANQNIDV